MQILSNLVIAIILAFSADAVIADTQVQVCINSLTAINPRLTQVKDAVDNFGSFHGYSGALTIHAKEQTLENAIVSARDSCCYSGGVEATSEEASRILDIFNNMAPGIQGAVLSISNKKSEFDSVPLAIDLVKADMRNLITHTQSLTTCLVDKAPSQYKAAANDKLSLINVVFNGAKSTFNF